MKALSSDTLMRPIFEVFDRILTHINGYSDDFLPNANFRFLRGARPMFKNIFF